MQLASVNHTTQLLDLSLVVASVYSSLQSMSPAISARFKPHESFSPNTPNNTMIESGESFKSCVSLTLGNYATSWSQNAPQEPEKQLQLMVERRMQISQLVQKCGGQHMFAAAAAASVREYINWATEELKVDDGKNSKVPAMHNTDRSTLLLCPPLQLLQVVIVKTSNDAGMGNRLQAIVYACLFAMVTKRVLLIDWAENSNLIVRACNSCYRSTSCVAPATTQLTPFASSGSAIS